MRVCKKKVISITIHKLFRWNMDETKYLVTEVGDMLREGLRAPGHRRPGGRDLRSGLAKPWLAGHHCPIPHPGQQCPWITLFSLLSVGISPPQRTYLPLEAV